MVDWVNYFSESNLVEVNLLVVGAVGEEKYKIFNIKPDPGKAKTERSWEHEMFLVDSKIIAIGSGSDCASLVVKKGKSVIGEMEMEIEEMEEKEAVDLAFDALKAAALKDWGTGGTLRVQYKTRTSSEEHLHLLVPKITEYCKSGYSSQLLVD